MQKNADFCTPSITAVRLLVVVQRKDKLCFLMPWIKIRFRPVFEEKNIILLSWIFLLLSSHHACLFLDSATRGRSPLVIFVLGCLFLYYYSLFLLHVKKDMYMTLSSFDFVLNFQKLLPLELLIWLMFHFIVDSCWWNVYDEN
jgi:hypothetical protein